MELTLDQALRKGIEAHKAGKVQEADRYYTAILQANPKHPDANHNMGVLAVGIGKVQEALPFYKTALEVKPSIAQYWLSYIDALIKLDQIDEVRVALEQAKNIGVKADGLDQIEKRLNKPSSQKSKTQDPPQNQLQPLINLYTEGQLERALNKASKLLLKYTNSVTLYNIIGATNQGLGKPEEAIEAYKKAISIKPDNAEAYNNMGIALKNLGKLEEAIEVYKKAISIMPALAQSYNNMGNTLKEQGKLEEAIHTYKKAISIKPDYAEVYNNIGVALKEQGKLEESIDAYKKAISIKPDNAEVYNNIGVALKEQGKLEESINAFNKAISIKPDYAEAYNNIGNTLKEQGKLEEAMKAYKKTLTLKPDHAVAALNLVKLPVGVLDPESLSLFESLKLSLSSFSQQSKYIFFQANLEKHKGRYEDAFSKFREANEMKLGEMSASIEELEQKYSAGIKNLRKWYPKKKELVNNSLTKLLFFAPSRSGKSTLEYLLTESSQVLPLYEAIKLKQFKPSAILKFEDIFYQSEKKLLDQGYKVVTSTAPASIFYSDRLIDELPNTFFIIIKRDEKDVAAEIFTNEYRKENLHSYDPIQITKYLNAYYEMCEILKSKIPNRGVTIAYEELIKNPEKTIESIGTLVSQTFKVKNHGQKLEKYGSEGLFRNHFAQLLANH